MASSRAFIALLGVGALSISSATVAVADPGATYKIEIGAICSPVPGSPVAYAAGAVTIDLGALGTAYETVEISGDAATACREDITSVVITNPASPSVTKLMIGADAFRQTVSGSTKMATLVFPSGLISLTVGDHAFAQQADASNTSLSGVAFPAGLKNLDVGTGAFDQTALHGGSDSLSWITFPDGLETMSIGDSAFHQHAFGGHNALTSVTFPSGLTSLTVGAFAFYQHAYGYSNSLTSVTFPNGLTDLTLGLRAFRQFAKAGGSNVLSSVNFPQSLRRLSIGQEAFQQETVDSAALASVSFPDGLQDLDLGYRAFYQGTGGTSTSPQPAVLASVSFPDGLASLTLGDEAFAQPDGTKLARILFRAASPMAATGTLTMGANVASTSTRWVWFGPDATLLSTAWGGPYTGTPPTLVGHRTLAFDTGTTWYVYPDGSHYSSGTVFDLTSFGGWDVTLPSATKAGYTFSGWCTALPADCDTPLPAGTSYSVSGLDQTLYAKFVPVSEPELTADTPTITGNEVVGSSLTANTGTWTPEPTFTYQWLRDGVEVSGATGTTYLLTPADLGASLSVRVTGTKAGYTSVTRTSAGTSVVQAGEFTSAPNPQVSGTPAVGSVLTCVPGTWQPTPDTLTCQWLRAGSPISGATSITYRAVEADVGSSLSVRVTGSRQGYVQTTRTSAETDPVPVPLQLTSTPTPTISGTARVGSLLTANTGTWQPQPVELAYEWFRSGTETPIPGATSASYRLTGDDYAKTVYVKVAGSKAGYESVSKSSNPTVKIAVASLSPTPTPTVNDTTPVVDQVLTASATWGPAPVKLAHQWYKVSKKGKSYRLAGATQGTYQVKSSDVGYRLKVKVRGTKDGYTAKSMYSKSTSYVKKASFRSVSVPTVSFEGVTPRVGKRLTAVPGPNDPASTSLAYRWYRVKISTGKSYSISKATKSRYVLTGSDLGYQIRVRVTVGRSGYNSQAKYSVRTEEVLAGLSGVTPKLSDTTPKIGQTLSITTSTGIDKWSPSGVTLSPSYQWYQNGHAINDATESTYVVQAGDLGKTLSVKVTGTATDYAPVSRTSSASSKVTS